MNGDVTPRRRSVLDHLNTATEDSGIRENGRIHNGVAFLNSFSPGMHFYHEFLDVIRRFY